MDTKDPENLSDKSNSKIKKMFSENMEVFKLVLVYLAIFATGCTAGYVYYQKIIIDDTGRELVVKNCCIPKENLVGTILKTEAIVEIDHLIEIGQSIKNNEEESTVWLMRVVAFIHGLNLEKDSEWKGHPMPAIEADIRYVLLDPSIEVQRQKTLGVLLGFRAAFRTQVYNP